MARDDTSEKDGGGEIETERLLNILNGNVDNEYIRDGCPPYWQAKNQLVQIRTSSSKLAAYNKQVSSINNQQPK